MNEKERKKERPNQSVNNKEKFRDLSIRPGEAYDKEDN